MNLFIIKHYEFICVNLTNLLFIQTMYVMCFLISLSIILFEDNDKCNLKTIHLLKSKILQQVF